LAKCGLGYILGYFIIKTSGADVMILKIFSPKKFVKKLAFFAQKKAKLYKNLS
jgi:hypothetical protein